PARSPHPRPATSRRASSGWGWCWSTMSRWRRAVQAAARSACSASPRPRTSHCSPATSRCCCAPAHASMTGWNCSPPTAISAGCPRRPAAPRGGGVGGKGVGGAVAGQEALPPPMYVALIRVGEASGSLDQVLEVLADERTRTEALKRRLGEAIRYPLFVLAAA